MKPRQPPICPTNLVHPYLRHQMKVKRVGFLQCRAARDESDLARHIFTKSAHIDYSNACTHRLDKCWQVKRKNNGKVNGMNPLCQLVCFWRTLPRTSATTRGLIWTEGALQTKIFANNNVNHFSLLFPRSLPTPWMKPTKTSPANGAWNCRNGKKNKNTLVCEPCVGPWAATNLPEAWSTGGLINQIGLHCRDWLLKRSECTTTT